MRNIYKTLEKVANVLIVVNIIGFGLMFFGHPLGKLYDASLWWLLVLIWIIMAVINKVEKENKSE